MIEKVEADQNCRTDKGREELQNSQKKTRFTEQRRSGKNRFICLVGCLIIHLIFQGGWEVLGRTGVLKGSSGCLNTGSCSFHLVAARETKVAGWCKGEQVFSVIQVGSCVTESQCFHPIGAGTLGGLVLPSSGCQRNKRVGVLKQVEACKTEVAASH